jgi:ATP-dependent Clp protease protease subunit
MNKIGTFEDFRHFAISNTNANANVLDAQVKGINNHITPYILEERQLNVGVYDIYSRMLLDRIVFLSGEVTTESMDTIVAQLLYLDSIDNRDISIYINSGGGDCYSGLELVSVMDFIESDVSTTVLGLAASMGAVISSSGTKGKRFLLPYSRFMIHQPLSRFGYSKFTDSKIALEEMESVRNDLYEVLSRNSNKPIEEIIEMCEHGDKWLKAEEVISLGFGDAVIDKNSRNI